MIERKLQKSFLKQKRSKTFKIGKKKKEIYNYLVELANTLNKKETYQHHDRDDYYGIRDIENLFGNVDVDDDIYYKPILVESSFKNSYKYYKSRGDKNKKLSVKQYLYKIMPYLCDIINDHKIIRI